MNIDKPYNGDYETLKKLQKLTKYQKTEFIEENKLTEVDLHVALLDPTKRQFKFITEFLIPKEVSIKKRFLEGVDLLTKAKDLISKSVFDLFATRSTIIKSELFEDKQLVDAFMVAHTQPQSKVLFTDLWGMTKETQVLEYDLTQDELIGEIADRYVNPEDHKITFEYTSYKFGP